MADSDELVSELRKQVDLLNAQVAETKAEAKDRRLKNGKLKEEIGRLTGDIATLSGERDSWKTKAEASHPDLQEKIDSLSAQLRSVTHKDAFRKAAEGKIHPDAIDAAWQLSGYQPAADEIDPASIEDAVARTAAGNPRLVIPEGGPKTVTAPAPIEPLTGLVGGGRGKSDTVPNAFRVTAAEYGDPRWMDKNQARMAEASKNGTLQLV